MLQKDTLHLSQKEKRSRGDILNKDKVVKDPYGRNATVRSLEEGWKTLQDEPPMNYDKSLTQEVSKNRAVTEDSEVIKVRDATHYRV
jgi:hypothetical protein